MPFPLFPHAIPLSCPGPCNLSKLLGPGNGGLNCYLSGMISVIAMMQLHAADSTTNNTNMRSDGFVMQTKDEKHFVFLYNSFVAACGADAGNSF